jgi:hypothetical protein
VENAMLISVLDAFASLVSAIMKCYTFLQKHFKRSDEVVIKVPAREGTGRITIHIEMNGLPHVPPPASQSLGPISRLEAGVRTQS